MKKLRWGETPWDALTREELLREVQRMYAALLAARSVMGLCRGPDTKPGPFWDRALSMANQVIRPIETTFKSEAIYQCFFRYATDLLFEGVGYGWVVCPECGTMLGGAPDMGEKCPEKQCAGVMRPLEWSDLAKEQP